MAKEDMYEKCKDYVETCDGGIKCQAVNAPVMEDCFACVCRLCTRAKCNNAQGE
jgi:hypothetical protein